MLYVRGSKSLNVLFVALAAGCWLLAILGMFACSSRRRTFVSLHQARNRLNMARPYRIKQRDVRGSRTRERWLLDRMQQWLDILRWRGCHLCPIGHPFSPAIEKAKRFRGQFSSGFRSSSTSSLTIELPESNQGSKQQCFPCCVMVITKLTRSL